jgi:hypothetical protein
MQINKIFLSLLIMLTSLSFYSCYYDKADVLYPGSNVPCDTTAISYNLKVVPLLRQQCYFCHGPVSPGGNILLGTYADDKVVALNGRLYGTISHANGFSPMPKGMAPMSSCQIGTIKKWIDAGIPNN